MVVVAILAIIGAAAFAGWRQNEYAGQYKRFVDDCRGSLVTARNFAIDNQTIVQVQIAADNIQVLAWEHDTNTWDLIDVVRIDSLQEGLLENNTNLCIHGLISGVQTPRQATAQTPPTGCAAATDVLQFEADGTFSDPNATFTTLENAGATLWIGNHQMTGDTRYAFIQIFPGGLIRAFDKVEDF